MTPALCIPPPCFIFCSFSSDTYQSLTITSLQGKKALTLRVIQFLYWKYCSLALKMLTQLTAQKKSKPRKAL